jgi:hypothetical protein
MGVTTPSSEQDRIAQLEAELARYRQNALPRDDSDRPWEVAKQHVSDEHTRAEAPVPYRGPGAVLHRFPILTGGSGGNLGGPWVRALAELLAQLGYATNNVIRGRSGHYDDSVAADLARFKAEHDVREPIEAYHGHTKPAQEIVENLCGPYTVQALFEKCAEQLDEPVEQLVNRVEHKVFTELR